MRRERMGEGEIAQALAELNASAALPWALVDGKLHREVKLASFVEAFGFMAKVALVAEAMDHHPDWRNVYDRVWVDLSTHDAGGITDLDFALASRIEGLLRP